MSKPNGFVMTCEVTGCDRTIEFGPWDSRPEIWWCMLHTGDHEGGEETMVEISWRDATDSMLADVDDVRLTAYNAANQSAWNVVAQMKTFEVDYDDKLGGPAQRVEIEMKTAVQGDDGESLDDVARGALNALEVVRRRLETDVTTAGV